jgi:hypothetical protein
MTATLAFDHLVKRLHPQLAARPDDRKGKNTQDAIKDAVLGALAVFVTQSPSLLASQRTRPQAKGRSNAESLLGMGAIPCDQQIRTWLDPVAPAELLPVFAGVYDALDGAGQVSPWRVFADQLLIALDGTDDLASQEIHGARCSQRTQAHGQVTYVHQAMTPLIVAPGRHEVIPLAPECITPQDGHAKPECAQVAAKRWIERQAGRYLQATLFGADRYGTQPFWALVRHHGFNGIVVGKPASHPTLYEWLAG